jgi:predicted nucleic acid-binding protein
MSAVADTSFILAYLNSAEAKHWRCVEVFNAQSRIYLPQSTLGEIGYMLTRSGGNRRTAYFLRHIPDVPKLAIEALTSGDLARTADILEQYVDARIDFVDATVAAVAERLSIKRILTLNQRDFSILRPAHVAQFELLPSTS